MKFLIDRCAGRRLAQFLAGEGHDVLEARTLGPDPGDEELLRMAAGQGRILVTMDKDFVPISVGHSGFGRLRGRDASSGRLDDTLRLYRLRRPSSPDAHSHGLGPTKHLLK